jgi:hypothetical protein
MHYLNFALLPGLLFALTACAAEPDPPATDPAADLETALIGTWETVEVAIDYATYFNGDTTHSERITEAEWGQKYGVHPPSTEFTPDGKLRRTHRMKTGEVANITPGIWRVQEDSLLVIEPNITFTYAYDLRGDRLELTGLTDQDRDGQRDDNYRAVFRQVSRSR